MLYVREHKSCEGIKYVVKYVNSIAMLWQISSAYSAVTGLKYSHLSKTCDSGPIILYSKEGRSSYYFIH